MARSRSRLKGDVVDLGYPFWPVDMVDVEMVSASIRYYHIFSSRIESSSMWVALDLRVVGSRPWVGEVVVEDKSRVANYPRRWQRIDGHTRTIAR